MGRLTQGLIAGAAGTAATNATTYLDMAVRGRPPRTTPERSAARMAAVAHLSLGGRGRAAHRETGLGMLMGYAVGAGTATGYALAGGARLPQRLAGLRRRLDRARPPRRRSPGRRSRLAGADVLPRLASGVLLGGVAMAASTVPMMLLGATDPRRWTLNDWLTDGIPHLVYGVVAATVLDLLAGPQPGVWAEADDSPGAGSSGAGSAGAGSAGATRPAGGSSTNGRSGRRPGGRTGTLPT